MLRGGLPHADAPFDDFSTCLSIVLTWTGVALLGAAGGVAIRWVSARTDSLGRPRPFPYVSVVAFSLLGLMAIAPFVLRVRLEGRLAAAASELVGAGVEVRCQSFGGAFVDAGTDLGYVAYGADGVPERRTLIKREQCGDLSDYLRSDKEHPTSEQIIAVHVLTHEAVHMSGVRSEAETECEAVQRNAQMAQLLGASREAAARLSVAYWREVYPRMPDAYRSEECTLGGALDAGRSDAPWMLPTGQTEPGQP